MSYAEVADIRKYLDQLDDDVDRDELLQDVLDRATSMIDTYLGFSYDGYETDTRVVYGLGTPYLTLPPHSPGTITLITPEGGDAVDVAEYTEQDDGTLYVLSGYYPYPGIIRNRGYGWGFSRYEVQADWGYGGPTEAIKEVCLELAMNIWKQKDKGFVGDFIGVTGASGQRFTGGLPRQLRDILDAEKDKYNRGVAIG